MKTWILTTIALISLGLLFHINDAWAEQAIPDELSGIDITGRLGDSVPLNLIFTDQNGNQTSLQKYFHEGKPIILTLNYFGCKTLCNMVLDGVAAGLNDPKLSFVLGQQFDVITVSIDPADTSQMAQDKRNMYLRALSRPVQGEAWPFLVGSESSIQALADAVGFHYRYDAESKQYAHAAGIFVLTPQGKISQILYGIEFPGKDLRLSLIEASLGSIGSPFDKILLWCFHYDAKERRYTPWAMGIMRIGAVFTLIVLGIFLTLMWRGERLKKVVHE